MKKTTAITLMKKSLRRDPQSAPEGQPGRLYILCCGNELTAANAGSYETFETKCPTCGNSYDKHGFVKGGF